MGVSEQSQQLVLRGQDQRQASARLCLQRTCGSHGTRGGGRRKGQAEKDGVYRLSKGRRALEALYKKEIDFCDIRQYVADTPEDPDFFDRVYQHLLQSGIKIYTYPKTCWKCHQSTDIYTYFLSRQLEEELGKEYAPQYHARVNLRLYERIGLGSLEKLDVYLSYLYPQIQKRYSREMDRYYHMCCCSHCGAHQGINFTVYRPEELMENKVTLDEMIDRVIDIRDVGIDKEFIKQMY